MELNILKKFELSERECARSYHLQIEAIKLAFAEALAEVGDPRHMRRSVAELLSEEFAERRAALIDPAVAGLPTSERQTSGGTVYLAASAPVSVCRERGSPCITGGIISRLTPPRRTSLRRARGPTTR